MAIYLIKKDGVYINRIELSDPEKWTPPAGATIELETPERLAQAKLDAAARALAEQNALTPQQRDQARHYLTESPDPFLKVARALAQITLSEINILRQGAGMQPRTMTQFVNAMLAKIDDGSAD